VTRYLIEHDVRGAPGKLSTTNLVATLHGEALDPNLAMLSAVSALFAFNVDHTNVD
jgi:hypothetical protein